MRILISLLFSLSALFTAFPASAGSHDTLDYGEAKLLPGWRTPDGKHIMAVAVLLNKGWKTYWRAPGEAGIPPNFDWTGSQNIASVKVLWPKPEVFETYGLRSVGYQRPVIIPVEITPRDPAKPVTVALRFKYGACSDICIPVQADFAANLPPTSVSLTTRDNRAIASSIATVPVAATASDIRSVQCTLRPDGTGFRIAAQIELTGPAPASAITLIETGDSDIWVGSSETSVSGRTVTALAPLENYGSGGLVVDRSALRLTLLGENLALDIRGCLAGS